MRQRSFSIDRLETGNVERILTIYRDNAMFPATNSTKAYWGGEALSYEFNRSHPRALLFSQLGG
jgi:hypothetical protein